MPLRKVQLVAEEFYHIVKRGVDGDFSGAFTSDSNYLYFGLATSPGKIIKKPK